MNVADKQAKFEVEQKEEIERLGVDSLKWRHVFVNPEPFQCTVRRKGRPLVVENEYLNEESASTSQAKRLKTEEQKLNELSDWDKYRATEKEVRQVREKMAEERLKLWKEIELKEDLDLTNLRTLPQFEKFNTHIPDNEFGDFISFYGFLRAFGPLLDNWDMNFTLKDLMYAIYVNDPQNQPLLTLMCCLLRSRNCCIATEDYDEADIRNEKEIPDDYRNELTGPYGDEIKSRNLLLERLRSCHGASLYNVQINENSLNQHIIYAFHTAGNCPRMIAMDVRKDLRGEISLAEDELFLFSLENQDLLADLQKMSICELTSSQRLKLISVFQKNLLTYGNFRKRFQDDTIELNRLNKRVLRLLYLEQQYKSDYDDTLKLMDEMFPDFKLKRNGHSKKVDDAIAKFLKYSTVRDAIAVTQMKTRFDYVESTTKREELRRIQQNVIKLCVSHTAQGINQIFRRLGIVVLGVDRLFRQYIYVEDLSLIFVEGPLDSAGYALNEHCQDTTEDEAKHASCTSDSSCPIHSCYSDKQWYLLDSEETLNQLMNGLDSRGLREGPLLVNLQACLDNIRRSLASMPDGLKTINSMFEIDEPKAELSAIDHKQVLCSKLLDFEEKLNTRFFLDERFVSERRNWRTALQQSGDTKHFFSQDGVVFDNGDILIFDSDQLEELGLALFQIANSLILDCLKEPFIDNHRGSNPVATTTFGNWALGVCNANSINELLFYLTSIDSAIKWSFKVPKSSPCNSCGSRGSKSTMIKCLNCTKPYHKSCVSLDQSFENWSCNSCAVPQIVQSSRRRKYSPGHFLRLSTLGNISFE